MSNGNVIQLRPPDAICHACGKPIKRGERYAQMRVPGQDKEVRVHGDSCMVKGSAEDS